MKKLKYTRTPRPAFMPLTPWEAFRMLGNATFYLAAAYPGINKDVHGTMPERKACEIILACKDLLEAVNL